MRRILPWCCTELECKTSSPKWICNCLAIIFPVTLTQNSCCACAKISPQRSKCWIRNESAQTWADRTADGPKKQAPKTRHRIACIRPILLTKPLHAERSLTYDWKVNRLVPIHKNHVTIKVT